MLIKMKNFKTFYEIQIACHLKELLIPYTNTHTHTHTHRHTHRHTHTPDKNILRLWNNNFLTEICRNRDI